MPVNAPGAPHLAVLTTPPPAMSLASEAVPMLRGSRSKADLSNHIEAERGLVDPSDLSTSSSGGSSSSGSPTLSSHSPSHSDGDDYPSLDDGRRMGTTLPESGLVSPHVSTTPLLAFGTKVAPVRLTPRKRCGHHDETVLKTRRLGASVDFFGSKFTTFNNRPVHTAHLYPGSRFVGQQVNKKHVYRVEVVLSHVDLRSSTLSGYLTIHNLTDDLPTLTTFFESEVVGDKYSFATKKWRSSVSNDLVHWVKFPEFVELQGRSGEELPRIYPHDQSTLFMRWKELFLAPDHSVRRIEGASFEGFYFIAYNRDCGDITGYYYHDDSEKYQLLSLTHQGGQAQPCFELA